jgi:oligosaccharide repeat unit polymerase
MYLTLSICALLLVLSLICSRNNIFAPSVITSGIWFIVLLLYITVDNKLNPLTDKFLDAINIWIVLFCISSLFTQSLGRKKINRIEPSRLARNIFYYFSIITFPLVLLKAYYIISLGISSNWMADLRTGAIGGIKELSIEDANPFYVVIWLVSYLIELYYYSKDNRKRVFVLFFIYLVFAFVSMAKIHFLILILSTIYILYVKQYIRFKHLIVGFVLLLSVLQGIQILRSTSKTSEHTIKGTLELYLLSPQPAFETVKPNSSKQFGENTCRFFYAIKNKLGMSEIKPVDTILKFVYVGVGTNTYTVLYPYYKDFGLMGIGIFAIIVGALSGFTYKRVMDGNIIYLIIYSLLLYEVIMQYGAEMFFTNLSLNLQRIIIAVLPFLITKYELFSLKRKQDERI